MSDRKTFLDYTPDQKYLFPQDVRDWLNPDDLSYFIVDVVAELDLSALYESYDGSKGGRPAYDPRMMVALIFYAYCTGIYSSRKIEEATYSSVPFRIVTGCAHPDHDTICSFRKRHQAAFKQIFSQILHLCFKAGLVKLGHISIDGSKIKANASKHKAMSYSRMKKEIDRIELEIQKILAEADRIDSEEDKIYGKNKSYRDQIPEELRRRDTRLKKIREAKAQLEAEAREAARKEELERKQKDEASKEAGEKKGKSKSKTKGVSEDPSSKAQYNFTDPESRIMLHSSSKSFEQSYNCQVAVDSEAQVIVSNRTSQKANDKKELKPLVENIKAHCGNKVPRKISGDAGYYSDENIKYLEENNIDGYVATGRLKHNEMISPCPRGRIPRNATPKERMARKLRTQKGQKIYSARKYIAEPVFGQIKGARGFRQFLLRGYESVQAEWDLICTTHNVLKLFRSGFNFSHS